MDQRDGLINESRVLSFSDAVFAFAATLLVLKIEFPAIDATNLSVTLPSAIFQLWPTYLANIISFLVIGYYWLNHHALFSKIKRFDSGLVWMNMVFLISISFLPFPVDLYGDYPTIPIAIMFYSATLAVVGFLLALMWVYSAYQHRLVDKDLGRSELRYYLLRFMVAPVIFALSVPIAAIDSLVAQFSWGFVIVGTLLINKLFK